MVKIVLKLLQVKMTFVAKIHQINLERLPSRLLFGFLIAATYYGCSSAERLAQDDLSDLYNRDEIKIKLEQQVYHRDSVISIVYLRIPSSDLTFRENSETSKSEASALIEVKVFPANLKFKRAVDSTLVRLREINSGNDDAFIHTAVNVATPHGHEYRATLKVTDINSGKKQVSKFYIDKRNQYVRQNFLIFQTDKRLPLYSQYVTRPSRLRIKNNQSRDMTVRYYNRQFPLPPPPFSNYNPPSFKYEADSVFSVRATPDFSILDVSKAGFYHILTDDSQKSGHTVFTFPAPFPVVSEPQQMFESLRYLTTEWEFREMRQRQNVREAMEKFWIDCAGSKDRAREMIRTYYNRVEESNEFFTSYLEGWKTDRGLIHIVYGKPNIVYKGPNSETWIYGEDNNAMSLSFTFIKVINPFTENDFRLKRDENYKASWYRAIESWRNGRIYAN